MPRRETLQCLARAFIGLAWEDGKVTPAEMNLLKDVTFQMPEMTADDWAQLSLYWLAPINDAGRATLFNELRAALRSGDDKAYAYRLFADMVELDGQATPAEEQALKATQDALERLDDSLQPSMARLLESVLGQRAGKFSHHSGGESKIYDLLRAQLSPDARSQMALDDYELEKLALAGAMMARVAYADREVDDAELATMDRVLQRDWSLQPDHASLVIDCAVDAVAQNLDNMRLFREFYEITLPQERVDFIDILFRIADAHEGVSAEEHQEIRDIAQRLKIDQADLALV